MAVWRDDAWARRRARRVRLALAAVAVVAALLSWRVDPSEPVTVAVATPPPSPAADLQWVGSAAVHGEPFASAGGGQPTVDDSGASDTAAEQPGGVERDASGTERCTNEQVLAKALSAAGMLRLDRTGHHRHRPLLQLADALLGRSDAERAVGMLLRDQLTHPPSSWEAFTQSGSQCPEQTDLDMRCHKHAFVVAEGRRLDRLTGLMDLALRSVDPAAVGVAAGALCVPGYGGIPMQFRSVCQTLASRWVGLAPDEALPKLLLALLSPSQPGAELDSAWTLHASRATLWSRLENQPDHVLSHSVLFPALDHALGADALRAVVNSRPDPNGPDDGSAAESVVRWCSAIATGNAPGRLTPCQNLARLMDNSPSAILMVDARRRLGDELGMDTRQSNHLELQELAQMRLQLTPDRATLARMVQAVRTECSEDHQSLLRGIAAQVARTRHAVMAARVGHSEAFRLAVAESGRPVEQLATEMAAMRDAFFQGKGLEPTP